MPRNPETFGAVAVRGLTDLQRALRRVEGSAGPELHASLKDIAGHVRDRAAGNVTNRTGRHGAGPTIRGSLRASATQRGASIYTTAPHGYVQDRGGQVGRHGATLLRRGAVSQYMTRAVVSERAATLARLDRLLAGFGREFES